jgi:arylsulfatase A-like enzyme
MEGGVDPAFFQSSGPLRGIKRDLYEGGIRVPMIARWPGRIQPGTVNQHMWAFWDFLPTAAALAGAPAVTNIDGISMMPTLMGQTQTNRHDFLYWEFYEGGFKQAARTNDWKAVRVKVGAPLELYDLRTDLAEQHDVAKQNAVLVERMETYLKTARTESDRWPIQAESEKK